MNPRMQPMRMVLGLAGAREDDIFGECEVSENFIGAPHQFKRAGDRIRTCEPTVYKTAALAS
jgi:hypothetical protein